MDFQKESCIVYEWKQEDFMARTLTRAQEIERSVFKRYKSKIWAPFLTAINTYELISPNDRIAVCISGGKDSMLMAKLFQLLQKHSDIPFETVFLVMDPGYTPENRKKIEENAEIMGIPLTIFSSNVFAVADLQKNKPCYLCARMRRGCLYNKASELGCNKIALGHHLNDVIETTVMAMFYSSKLETIIPKSHSENYPQMELIRPMYCVKEENILSWCEYNDLDFIRCACRFTEKVNTEDPAISKRQETKELIRALKQTNPEIEHNIFKALHAVQIESFPGYKANGNMHSFLENYDTFGKLISVKDGTSDQ